MGARRWAGAYTSLALSFGKACAYRPALGSVAAVV
jgi:hypothetical protein